MEPSASLGIAVQSWRGFPGSQGEEQRHGTEPGPHNGWDPDGRGTGSCITEATWVGMHKIHIGDKEDTRVAGMETVGGGNVTEQGAGCWGLKHQTDGLQLYP